MLQALMTAPGKIEFRQVDKPVPKPDEVLVRIKRIGICGSDIHVYHGRHHYMSYPVVQGHEVSGEIDSVGTDVTGFKPEEKVTFMPQVTCGHCYPCRHGMYHICDSLKVMGFQTNGAGQEYFPVPASMVLRLPDSLSFEAGAMIEPAAVAVHALRRAGTDIREKKVLVIGAGPIGNIVGQVAKGLGAAKVMAVDISAFRLEKTSACGIDCIVNPQTESPKTAIAREFGPDKADVIMECVGAEATIAMAIECARKGTTIVIVGLFGSQTPVDLSYVQDRELSLVGSLMYVRPDWEDAIALARSGALRLEPLVTDHFPFTAYLEAYQYLDGAKDRAMKVMLDVA